MGGHRELCLVGMCGGPWDSLVEVQCLAINIDSDSSFGFSCSLFSRLLQKMSQNGE